MSERTCSTDGCEGPYGRITTGMCSKHYQRYKLHGTTEDRPRRRWIMCAHPECSRQARAGGLCRAHTADPQASNDTLPPRFSRRTPGPEPYCVFLACDRPHKANGLCHEHKLLMADPDFEPDGPTCSWPKCHSASVTRGLCTRHVHFRYLALRPYGMTLDQYDALHAAQSGRCAICAGVNANGNWLAVDHDHSCCPTKGTSCGRCIRALLCGNCNLMIGHSGDAAERLRAGADYLDQWNAREVMRAV